MKESGYYPPGADNEWAPWNQSEPEEKEFDVTCSQSLSKTVPVLTNNYIPGASGVDYESDGEGGYEKVAWEDAPDTSETNWAEEYHSNDYHTPLQLIKLFSKYLQHILNGLPMPTSPEHLQWLIGECEGWTEDDCEFIGE